MTFDPPASVLLHPGTFSIFAAPPDAALRVLNGCLPRLQRFLTLYVCGNHSRLLSSIHRSCSSVDVQRAFTAFQLLTILEESHHSILWVEHDPTLYEGAEETIERVAGALKEAASLSATVLYSPHFDPVLARMACLADRIIYLDPSPAGPPRRMQHLPGGAAPGGQATLRSFE